MPSFMEISSNCGGEVYPSDFRGSLVETKASTSAVMPDDSHLMESRSLDISLISK